MAKENLFSNQRIGILMLLLLISIIILGCASGNQPDANQGNSRQRFTNLTSEQRQQMMQQRMQAMAKECEGKNEGDSCAIKSQRGDRQGTCKMQNESLLCMGNFSARPNRQQ